MSGNTPSVLFAVIPERGHLNPCIGVAQHLADFGVDVSFTAPAPLANDVRAAGFEHFYGPEPTPTQTEQAPASRGAEFASQVTDPLWLRSWIRRLLIDEAEVSVGIFEDAIAASDPDLVVVDPMLYPAIFAAHDSDTAWVALSNSLNPVLDSQIESDLLDTVEWLASDRAELFARRGLDDIVFRGCDALSPTLNVAFCTPRLSGRDVPGVQQVGPARTPRPRGDELGIDLPPLDGRPLLYCSFGSQVFHQPERFERIIDATAGRDIHVVLALHDLLGSTPFDDLAENIHA